MLNHQYRQGVCAVKITETILYFFVVVRNNIKVEYVSSADICYMDVTQCPPLSPARNTFPSHAAGKHCYHFSNIPRLQMPIQLGCWKEGRRWREEGQGLRGSQTARPHPLFSPLCLNQCSPGHLNAHFFSW